MNIQKYMVLLTLLIANQTTKGVEQTETHAALQVLEGLAEDVTATLHKTQLLEELIGKEAIETMLHQDWSGEGTVHIDEINATLISKYLLFEAGRPNCPLAHCEQAISVESESRDISLQNHIIDHLTIHKYSVLQIKHFCHAPESNQFQATPLIPLLRLIQNNTDRSIRVLALVNTNEPVYTEDE